MSLREKMAYDMRAKNTKGIEDTMADAACFLTEKTPYTLDLIAKMDIAQFFSLFDYFSRQAEEMEAAQKRSQVNVKRK